MATSDLDRIKTIKSQALSVIEQITLTPKPTYSVDGQSVSWGAYLQQLQQTVAWCDQQLSAEEPFEVQTQGYT